jgi:hypothetical protein
MPKELEEEWKKLMEKHGVEIELMEKVAGKNVGRLMYAISILSDVEGLSPQITPEVEEAKLLIMKVIEDLRGKSEKLKEVL